jgi:hypothetical protein
MPIIPTAEYAKELADTVTNIAATLDPTARKNREMEMALLGAKLRGDNIDQEFKEAQMKMFQDEQAREKAYGAGADGRGQQSFPTDPGQPVQTGTAPTSAVPTPPAGMGGPTPTSTSNMMPHTNVMDYNENILKGDESPGQEIYTLDQPVQITQLPS